MAHALDPRFKELKVLESDKDREEVHKLLLAELIEGKPESVESKRLGTRTFEQFRTTTYLQESSKEHGKAHDDSVYSIHFFVFIAC